MLKCKICNESVSFVKIVRFTPERFIYVCPACFNSGQDKQDLFNNLPDFNSIIIRKLII